MGKNYIIITLLVLLLVPMVIGFEYTIETIKNCEGIIKVNDRTTDVAGYSLKDCARKGENWECPCKPLPRKLVLLYDDATTNTYSFMIEYYVGDNKNLNNKRTYSYEGLKLGGMIEKKPIEMPKLEAKTKTILFIGLGLFGLIILGGIVFIIKKLLNQKDLEDKSDYPKQNFEEHKETIELDEDITNILDKYG